MRTFVALLGLLLAGCSRPAETPPAPEPGAPAPAPEPAAEAPAPPPDPAPTPEAKRDPVPPKTPPESRVPKGDLRVPLREIFEVKPKADQTTGHDLIAFVGRMGDLEELTESHLAKDGQKKVRLLETTDDLVLFLLWGRRIDVLPKQGLEADRSREQVRVSVKWQYTPFGGMPGPADVPYVGYGVRLGRLRSGPYVVEVQENSRDPQEGKRRSAQVTFEVHLAKGQKEPEPPSEAGRDLPRLTCQSGCCVGMHTFNLSAKCRECKRVEVADGHKYCSDCAQRLGKCVHCGEHWK